MNTKNASERYNDFVVVIVAGVLSLDSFPDNEPVMSCVRRSYDDMLKEERVIGLSLDG